MGAQNKQVLIDKVIKLFTEESETGKAFILGYMIATSQQIEQTTTA